MVNDELLQLMAKAGCHILRFGVEQGDDEMMKFVEKKTNLKLVKKNTETKRIFAKKKKRRKKKVRML